MSLLRCSLAVAVGLLLCFGFGRGRSRLLGANTFAWRLAGVLARIVVPVLIVIVVLLFFVGRPVYFLLHGGFP